MSSTNAGGDTHPDFASNRKPEIQDFGMSGGSLDLPGQLPTGCQLPICAIR